MSLDANRPVPKNCQTCRVCSVKIDAEGTVHFSFGKPGSRERLYARVCQFVEGNDGCINDADSLKPITPDDAYGTEEDRAMQIPQLLAAASSPPMNLS